MLVFSFYENVFRIFDPAGSFEKNFSIRDLPRLKAASSDLSKALTFTSTENAHLQ